MTIVLGLALVYWQSLVSLRTETNQQMQAAERQLNLILQSAQAAAEWALALQRETCERTALQLRRRLTESPFLRSLNLVTEDSVHCTSIFGEFRASVDSDQYVEGTLRLMEGNVFTPNRSVLAYRLSQGRESVVVGIDGQQLSSLLTINSRDVPLSIVVGALSIDDHGTVAPHSSSAEEVVHLASSSFPFCVEADYGEHRVLPYAWEHYQVYFLFVLLAGALVGAISYKLILRGVSPAMELWRALHAGEFKPYYQPVADTRTGQWHGAEVLMRWAHPHLGVVPPDHFIPMAESLNLIVSMTRSLMARVKQDLLRNLDTLPQGFHIGINITSAHCHDLRLLDDCRDFVRAFAPGRVVLVLEITERHMISPTSTTEQLFSELRRLGVRIALDDFGTGHSSLVYLQHFHVDYLKIDRSFISMIGSDALSRHLVDNILDLAMRLELGTIAEGVENDEQASYLHQHGISLLQGYLYSRPLPARDAFELLKKLPAPVA